MYSSPDIIRNLKARRLRWAGHVARMEPSRNAYRVLVGKPEGRPRRRWEDNIKVELKEVGCVPGHWIALVEKGTSGGFNLCQSLEMRHKGLQQCSTTGNVI